MNRNHRAWYYIAAGIILALLVVPTLNDYANTFRARPGIGGEIMLPLLAVAAVGIWRGWRGMMEDETDG